MNDPDPITMNRRSLENAGVSGFEEGKQRCHLLERRGIELGGHSDVIISLLPSPFHRRVLALATAHHCRVNSLLPLHDFLAADRYKIVSCHCSSAVISA